MNAKELANDGYEKFTREGLLNSVRQQRGEIESLLVQLESLLKFIDERGETRALIIWKAQGK
jgi:phage-related protein